MKQSSSRFLMWVMVIWLQAHLSIAAELSKSNGTTSTSVVCDGSVEDCLNVDHLDSQLPTISSSHFRRILAGSNNYAAALTNDPANPAACPTINGYHKCGTSTGPGEDSRCPQAPYYRPCHKL